MQENVPVGGGVSSLRQESIAEGPLTLASACSPGATTSTAVALPPASVEVSTSTHPDPITLSSIRASRSKSLIDLEDLIHAKIRFPRRIVVTDVARSVYQGNCIENKQNQVLQTTSPVVSQNDYLEFIF